MIPCWIAWQPRFGDCRRRRPHRRRRRQSKSLRGRARNRTRARVPRWLWCGRAFPATTRRRRLRVRPIRSSWRDRLCRLALRTRAGQRALPEWTLPMAWVRVSYSLGRPSAFAGTVTPWRLVFAGVVAHRGNCEQSLTRKYARANVRLRFLCWRCIAGAIVSLVVRFVAVASETCGPGFLSTISTSMPASGPRPGHETIPSTL